MPPPSRPAHPQCAALFSLLVEVAACGALADAAAWLVQPHLLVRTSSVRR